MGEVSERDPPPGFLASLGMTFLLIAMACTQQVTAARWQHMSPDAKTVYVRSLLGGEKAKDAKGGFGHRYTGAPEDYVKRIDEAYSRGSEADPAVIFAGLTDKR